MHVPAGRRHLRRLLASPLGRETRRFAASLSGAASSGRPVVLGSASHEPWHFVAHLEQEALGAGVPQLAPTWVRWSAPVGAPPRLACTVADLADLARRRPVLVMGEDADADMLERVADVRRAGGLVLGVDGGHGEVAGLAHEQLVVDRGAFDAAGHLLSVLAPGAGRLP